MSIIPYKLNNIQGFIYYLEHKGEVVYIGQTTQSVNLRVSTHQKKKIFDKAYYVEIKCEHVKYLSLIEAIQIFKFNPRYNLSIPKNLFILPKKQALLYGDVSRMKSKDIGTNVYYDTRDAHSQAIGFINSKMFTEYTEEKK